MTCVNQFLPHPSSPLQVLLQSHWPLSPPSFTYWAFPPVFICLFMFCFYTESTQCCQYVQWVLVYLGRLSGDATLRKLTLSPQQPSVPATPQLEVELHETLSLTGWDFIQTDLVQILCLQSQLLGAPICKFFVVFLFSSLNQAVNPYPLSLSLQTVLPYHTETDVALSKSTTHHIFS